MNEGPTRRTKFSFKDDGWAYEILACIASAACYVVIIFLLAFYDGKPVFHIHGITLNTIVSLLSTASKTLVIWAVQESISQWKWISFSQDTRQLSEFETLDSASRGPVGSLKLLWETRASRTVAIAALAVVVGVLFDPFMQLLIGYKSEPYFEADANTIIPQAQRYAKGTRAFQKNSGFNFSSSSHDYIAVHTDFAMQSAVLFGLSKSIEDVSQQLPFKCKSGNCRWKPSESLAVCSSCNDVTGSLTKSNISSKGLYFALNQDFIAPHDGGDFNLTAFTLPNGLWLDNLPGWNNSFDALGPNVTKYLSSGPGGALMSTFGTGNASETNTFQSLDTLIWVLDTIRVSPNSATNTSIVWPNYPIEAMECALYYCVNKFETQVINGTLSENATRIDSATRSPDSWIPNLQFFKVTSEYDNVSTVLPPGVAKSLQFINPWSAIPRTDLMLGNNFNLSQTAVDSLSDYFQTTFTTNLTSDLPSHRINGFLLNDSVIQFQPSVVQPLFASLNLNATFHALAASMSNAIRAGGDGSNSTIAGQNGPEVTYVSIQWAWLSLPLVVELLGVICLVLTIRASRAHGIAVLKSNSLAVLARGALVSDALEGATSVKDLVDASKKHYTQLSAEKAGIAGSVDDDASIRQRRRGYDVNNNKDDDDNDDEDGDEIPLQPIQRPRSTY